MTVAFSHKTIQSYGFQPSMSTRSPSWQVYPNRSPGFQLTPILEQDAPPHHHQPVCCYHPLSSCYFQTNKHSPTAQAVKTSATISAENSQICHPAQWFSSQRFPCIHPPVGLAVLLGSSSFLCQNIVRWKYSLFPRSTFISHTCAVCRRVLLIFLEESVFSPC